MWFGWDLHDKTEFSELKFLQQFAIDSVVNGTTCLSRGHIDGDDYDEILLNFVM